MFGMKGMGDVMKLIGKAKDLEKMQAQIQTRAKNRTATGESGAGIVKVVVNGIGEIVDIRIDPEALKEPDTLGSLLASAANIALNKGKEILMEETSTAMGGLGGLGAFGGLGADDAPKL